MPSPVPFSFLLARMKKSQMRNKEYTIGQVARKCNTTPRILRYLEATGKIPSVPRDRNNIRRYSMDDIDVIQRALGDDCGVTMAEAASLCGISKATLKRWERRGLATEPGRDANNVRRYTDRDIERIREIMCDSALLAERSPSLAKEDDNMWMDLIAMNQQVSIPYLGGDKEYDLIIRCHGDGRCKMKLFVADDHTKANYVKVGTQVDIIDDNEQAHEELSVSKGEYKYSFLTPQPGYLFVDLRTSDVIVYVCITEHYDTSGMVIRDIPESEDVRFVGQPCCPSFSQ